MAYEDGVLSWPRAGLEDASYSPDPMRALKVQKREDSPGNVWLTEEEYDMPDIDFSPQSDSCWQQ